LDPLTYLFSLEQFGIKFGLDNIRALLSSLGDPQRAFRTIHIAGTNGKGSVTAMVDAVLQRAGYRSARYTSPHLIDLSERFAIDGHPVGHAQMRRAADDIQHVIEALIADGRLSSNPTFFEATTAMAFEIFRRAQVEFAVVEVGLGGRLDSTNVVDPIVAAITSIDFDHQQYLGNTLAEIAAEKAGIIKVGVPIVVGEVAPEAYDVIERVANERRAPLIRADSISREWDSIDVGLRGRHQRDNAKVAIAVLETLERSGTKIGTQAIVAGLANVSWPGRLDHRTLPNGHEIILDAAHNPAGARALASYIRDLRSAKPTLVFGAMRDKDLDAMLAVLLPEVGRVIVTKPSNPRAANPEELALRIAAAAPSLAIDVVASPPDAVAAATSESPLVVVAGSIFLLGDVLRWIDA